MGEKEDLVLIVKDITKEEKEKILKSIPKSKDDKVNHAVFDCMSDLNLFHHIVNDLEYRYNRNEQESDSIEIFNKSLELFDKLSNYDQLDPFSTKAYNFGACALIDEYDDFIDAFFNENCKKDKE